MAKEINISEVPDNIIQSAFLAAVYDYSVKHLRDDPDIGGDVVTVCESMYEDTEANLRKKSGFSKEEFNQLIQKLKETDQRFSEKNLSMEAEQLLQSLH